MVDGNGALPKDEIGGIDVSEATGILVFDQFLEKTDSLVGIELDVECVFTGLVIRPNKA